MTDERIFPDKAAETGDNRLREIWSSLMRARSVSGFNPWQPVRQRHERRYTRAYADHRQRKGGGLYGNEQKRLAEIRAHQPGRPAPAPSAKAAARRKQPRSMSRAVARAVTLAVRNAKR